MGTDRGKSDLCKTFYTHWLTANRRVRIMCNEIGGL